MRIEIDNENKEIWHFDVEYASQDPDLTTLPGASFINKTEPGCGLSTLVLENNQNVLLMVPTQALCINKVSQYMNSQFDDDPMAVYPARERFGGEMLAVYEGVTSKMIEKYIGRVRCAETPIKIICVYDSIMKCEDFIDDIDLLCCDEADALTEWASLKAESKKQDDNSDAITEVYRIARQNIGKTCFFSATVVEKTYLPEWVTQLRQIRMEWAGTIRATPILMKRVSPFLGLRKEILEPLLQNGEVTIADRKFRKAIVAINSVETPTKIIREMGIPPETVAVLSGSNPRNTKKTKGRYNNVDPTDLPTITFITSAYWRGLDLWDREAMTVVVSNTSKLWQMVDLETSLPQAIRRQRDKSNPNYDRFIFIYNEKVFNKTEEQIFEEWNERHQRLEQCCHVLNSLEEEGRFEEFESTRKTFSGNREFIIYTNREQGVGYQLNENLFQSQKRRVLVTRRVYSLDNNPVAEYFEETPIIIPDPCDNDSTSWDSLRSMFVKLRKGEDVHFSDEQMLSDNYQLLRTCHEVFNTLPKRLDTARLKCSHIGNEDAQYEIDLLAPFQVGHRYASSFVEKHMKSIYREYGVEEKTSMATNIKVLQYYGLELERVKSSTIFYDIISRPEQKF